MVRGFGCFLYSVSLASALGRQPVICFQVCGLSALFRLGPLTCFGNL
jgi:hypothetical protein